MNTQADGVATDLDRTTAATPRSTPHSTPYTSSSVLDRVAARVRQRLAVERSTPDHVGEGGHQASLVRPSQALTAPSLPR